MVTNDHFGHILVSVLFWILAKPSFDLLLLFSLDAMFLILSFLMAKSVSLLVSMPISTYSMKYFSNL